MRLRKWTSIVLGLVVVFVLVNTTAFASVGQEYLSEDHVINETFPFLGNESSAWYMNEIEQANEKK